MKKVIFASLFLFGLVIYTPAQAQTIVEIAQGDEQFSSLVGAVVAEELVETLSSEGPFTVFAPTNEAFATLPGYAARALEENPDVLSDILLYHVVPGEFIATDVLGVETLETALGEDITVDANTVKVSGAGIIATDIIASNGVVHVIDTVMLPPSVQAAALSLVLTDLRDALRLYVELLSDMHS
jgi:transforming growth factor-beta-induced protein